MGKARRTGHHIRHRPSTSAFAVGLAYHPQGRRSSRECHVELHGSTGSSELNEQKRPDRNIYTDAIAYEILELGL